MKRKKKTVYGKFINFPFINLSIEYQEGFWYGMCIADEEGRVRVVDNGDQIADDFWSHRTTKEWKRYMGFNERCRTFPKDYIVNEWPENRLHRLKD